MLCLVEVKKGNDRKGERENRCFPLIGGGERNWGDEKWVGNFPPMPTKYNLSQGGARNLCLGEAEVKLLY